MRIYTQRVGKDIIMFISINAKRFSEITVPKGVSWFICGLGGIEIKVNFMKYVRNRNEEIRK